MNRINRYARSAAQGLLVITGKVVLGASGAISSSEIDGRRMSITKTATKTGRYTLQLLKSDGVTADTALKFRGGTATILGPDDAALTTTKGLTPVWRADTISTNGQIFLQFVQTNAGNADTEIQDSASFCFTVWLMDSAVV